MTELDLWEMLIEAFHQISQDLFLLLPKIFISLIIILFAFFSIKIVNMIVIQILKFLKLNEWFEKFTGFGLSFSLNRLVIVLADIGIILIAFYLSLSMFLDPYYIQIIFEGLRYFGRIASIFLFTIFLSCIFGVGLSKIQVEARLRNYIWFIILLLITAMLVDVTSLSESVKNALIFGVSIGVGISIGVFAVWYFFHDYFDRTPVES